jgi:hypothetical protein
VKGEVSLEFGTSDILMEYRLWVMMKLLHEFVKSLHITMKRCTGKLASVECHYEVMEWHHRHPYSMDR